MNFISRSCYSPLYIMLFLTTLVFHSLISSSYCSPSTSPSDEGKEWDASSMTQGLQQPRSFIDRWSPKGRSSIIRDDTKSNTDSGRRASQSHSKSFLMTTPVMISHEITSNEMTGLHTLVKRSSGPTNTKKYLHQIQVDAKGFSRPPNAYDPPNTIDFLPHNLSVILIKWHPQPAIRVSWLFTSKMPCEAFQIMYHPIASRFRYIIEVPCSVRNVTIERLLPSTEYLLTVNRVPWPDIPASSSSLDSESNHIYPPSSSSSTPGFSSNTGIDSSRKNTRYNTIDITDSVTKDSSSTPSFESGKRRGGDASQVARDPLSFASEPGAGSPITSFYNNPRYSFQGSAPNVIRFISPQIEYSRFSKFKSSSLIIRRDHDMFNPETGAVLVKKGELAVVVFVLSGWMLIIFIFVKKWGKIRGIETVSTFQGGSIPVHPASGISPSATAFPGQGFSGDSGLGVGLTPAISHVRGSITSTTGGAGLRSQKSKESDESSGINEASFQGYKESGASGTLAAVATTSATTSSSSAAPVPIPGVVCSSIKKKRLEDAMHQFLVMKNQQAIASGGHGILGSSHYYGNWNGGYGYSLHSTSSASSRNYYYCDPWGKRQVRSQDNPRVSISAASNHRPIMTRRGSLEGGSPGKIIRSESHLRLLRESSRMNRSAENLLIDFHDEDTI